MQNVFIGIDLTTLNEDTDFAATVPGCTPENHQCMPVIVAWVGDNVSSHTDVNASRSGDIAKTGDNFLFSQSLQSTVNFL